MKGETVPTYMYSVYRHKVNDVWHYTGGLNYASANDGPNLICRTCTCVYACMYVYRLIYVTLYDVMFCAVG